MPYMIIYMRYYLGFSTLEYSVVFGAAIILGAAINILLGRISDRHNKVTLLYLALTVMSLGLVAMYTAKGMSHAGDLVFFGISGFSMITGYIFVSQLTGSIVRDHTPTRDAGKLQGVRMVFSVLIPMIVGPLIGNAINRAMNIPLSGGGADLMTTSYVPAPEIYLAAALACLIAFPLVYLLSRIKQREVCNED